MGNCITSGIIKDFDLAGTGIGFVDVDKIITGEDIEAGDVLIGIESNGIHSNGYSLARKALFDDGGFSIDDKMPNCDTTIGEELIRPTELYVKPIVALFKEEYEIHGLAHITGGGFTNLRRLKKVWDIIFMTFQRLQKYLNSYTNKMSLLKKCTKFSIWVSVLL